MVAVLWGAGGMQRFVKHVLGAGQDSWRLVPEQRCRLKVLPCSACAAMLGPATRFGPVSFPWCFAGAPTLHRHLHLFAAQDRADPAGLERGCRQMLGLEAGPVCRLPEPPA